MMRPIRKKRGPQQNAQESPLENKVEHNRKMKGASETKRNPIENKGEPRRRMKGNHQKTTGNTLENKRGPNRIMRGSIKKAGGNPIEVLRGSIRKQGQAHRIMKGQGELNRRMKGSHQKPKEKQIEECRGAIRKQWELIKKTMRNQQENEGDALKKQGEPNEGDLVSPLFFDGSPSFFC